MIEMIITPERHEPGEIITIAISETEKFIRRASFFIRSIAGTTESGEHIHEAIKIREKKPIRK